MLDPYGSIPKRNSKKGTNQRTYWPCSSPKPSNATTALPEDESRKFEPVKSGGAQVRSNKQGFGFSLVKRFYNFITKLKTIWQKGMQMWEELEDQYLSELSKPNKVKSRLQNMGLDGLVVIGRVDSDTNACLLAENSRTLW